MKERKGGKKGEGEWCEPATVFVLSQEKCPLPQNGLSVNFDFFPKKSSPPFQIDRPPPPTLYPPLQQPMCTPAPTRK